jgi:hypothetical protein
MHTHRDVRAFEWVLGSAGSITSPQKHIWRTVVALQVYNAALIRA